MRIAYLLTRSDTIGGSHIHVRDLGVALMKLGHEVYIIIGGNGPIVDHLESFGLEVIAIPEMKRNISPFSDLKSYFNITDKLRSLDPDIISAHSSKAGFIGRLAARNLSIPVLFTAHGWSFTSGKSIVARMLYKYLEKVATVFTDFIITVSDYDKTLALNHLSVKGDKLKTIHNGMKDVDPGLFAKPGKAGIVNIIKVARFDQQKNHAGLLHAVSGLTNIKLHFVGDGPLLKDVKELADSLGISGSIKYYGRIEHVEKVLAEGQVFVLVSNWEGFPRSTVEAMRAGLPVVVSNVGGAAEAVKNGVSGFVVEKNDIKKLRYVIKQLVDDPDLRTKMGKASRNHYEEHLTFDRMFSETVDIYKKLLGDIDGA
ncbi:MAG: glycosyltransferase family 4 protein [Balneolaceae bacterium]|nr:glycosyltransferase family 4 protein [Balneolaceae bacterium]MDR9409712.1 glycosyltransferase family 4 protein [Balneolaceae bacterium]